MKRPEVLPTPEGGAEVWPLSVAAYHVLSETGLIPERTELLHGLVYHKMSKSPFHSFLVQVLQEMLRDALPPGCLLRTEQPITCTDSEPEPDFAIVRGKIADFRRSHPKTAELVIEVCVTSAEFDRSKLRAYASAGVKECWLVLGPEKKVEVYRFPSGTEFRQRSEHGSSEQLTSDALPALDVDLSKLFA